jgi:1-acyl-sn-glycerol-3-phosphate acyltransferase
MRIIKNIAGSIWAVWGITWFVITLFIIIIPVVITDFMKEPARSRIFWKLSRIWMQMYLPLVGCFLRIRGKAHFQKGSNYIVVCNHNSLMDVPLSSPFIPGINRTIAKIEMMKVPVFNLIYKRGSVLVDRKSEASRRKSYDDMKAVLEKGWHMCIYPEGTRNKTDEPLRPFKDGAFRLAVDTGTPIIPCLLFNTKKVLPPHKKFFMRPHPLYIHFLEPVDTVGRDAGELKNHVYELMKNYYMTHQHTP